MSDLEKKPMISQENVARLKSAGSFVWEIAKVVAISLAIILPIRYFLIQPFYVRGASMEPNFYDYEYLIINEITYRFNDPVRGEVVVLHDPRDSSQFFIKRIIGLPGEDVELKDNEIYIYNEEHPQGIKLDESAYLDQSVRTKGPQKIWQLGEDEYFILGDNRGASLDSRVFGEVDEGEIIGKAWLRAWPVTRATHFDQTYYNL